MTGRIAAQAWQPVGVPSLDAIADRVVRSTVTTLVEAGPGAGKTEMLAQRACFLLQTGACPRPRRILAVSYKRDAARNLRERVARRAGDDAHRLLSMTLDAFAKDLLDRFSAALPPALALARGYEISYPDQIVEFLTTLELPNLPGDERQLRGMRAQDFLNIHYCGRPLWPRRAASTILEFAADELFRVRWQASPSRLDFQMIARLAEAILLTNPRLLAALRAAFSHVFIDEFQDTTTVQYALFRAAFGAPGIIVTAVGDDKQRIMGWAGAMGDAFKEFSADFSSSPEYPIINYRAAPELVAVLTHLASALTSRPAAPMQPTSTAAPGGECGVYRYKDENEEAIAIADIIEHGIRSDGLVPGDFAVLVRQKVDAYGAVVAAAVSARSVRVRIESAKTEFLTSQFALDLVAALRLAVHGRAPDEWERLRGLLSELHQGQVARSVAIERAFATFCEGLGRALAASAGAKAAVRAALDSIVAHWGEDAYLKTRARTGDRESLGEVLDALTEHLETVFVETGDWRTAVDDAAGIAFVPIMTIHKAKGREHHTVFFVGLEDNAFWSFKTDPDEAMRSFFVAFSRARRRVLFTFSEVRQKRSQSISSIRPIYELLTKAGVPLLKYVPSG